MESCWPEAIPRRYPLFWPSSLALVQTRKHPEKEPWGRQSCCAEEHVNLFYWVQVKCPYLHCYCHGARNLCNNRRNNTPPSCLPSSPPTTSFRKLLGQQLEAPGTNWPHRAKVKLCNDWEVCKTAILLPLTLCVSALCVLPSSHHITCITHITQ